MLNGQTERREQMPAPEELYLEVTNRCNLRCRICPQFFGMEERFHDLAWERFLAISDDAATPETYQAVRGVDGFARILANLRRFKATKATLGVESPRVSLWLTG